MSKKKNYWYILVMANDGPAFVTKVDFGDKSAEWQKTEKPEELTEAWAKDTALGLNWNGYLAYPVCSQVEIDRQPYRYSDGHFKWEFNNMD